MSLHFIEGKQAKDYPEGYKFSWIAFSGEDPSIRVLFDCHPPKGPHAHFDADQEGKPFEWESLESAQHLFMNSVIHHFGPLTDEEEEK